MACRGRLPRRTVRLRLTLWYGGLFLAFGTTLLAVTYALVVQAFVGNTAGNAFCQGPHLRCRAIGAQQALALALRDHATVLHELLTRSEVALAVMTALAVAFGWIIADRVLRPLRAITATARRISAASLDERLALSGPDDEFRELGDTFDGLLARLEASFNAHRQFIANASHELRTPLARQRVISQVALSDPGATVESLSAAHQRVIAAGAEQEQLIDALLTLARGQAGLDKREPFDFAAVTSRVIAGAPARSRPQGHHPARGTRPGANLRQPQPGRAPHCEPHRQRAALQPARRPGPRHHRTHAVPVPSCRSPIPGPPSPLAQWTGSSAPSSG